MMGGKEIDPRKAWIKYAESYLQVVDGLVAHDGKGKTLREKVLYPKIFFRLGGLNGKRVLDVGTGEGALARLALEKGAEQVVGIDISPFLAKQAQERSRGKEDLVIADASLYLSKNGGGDERTIALPFANDSFDTVIFSLVGMWLPQMQALGSELARVTKPGARTVMTILNPEYNRGTVDPITHQEMKKIDHHAGPFPYFHRKVDTYQRYMQDKNGQEDKLMLIDTEFVKPDFQAVRKNFNFIPRVIKPEFVIMTFETVR